jgi:tetratricopeptide (TPR) repeat protein
MLNTKQVVVVGLVLVLMTALFSLDIKGLVSAKIQQRDARAETEQAAVTLETISEHSKQTLSASLVQQITDLENALNSASAVDKLALKKQLAQKWDDVNVVAPSAFYYELIANEEKTYPSWLKAGDKFTNAYQNTQDSLVQPALVQRAMAAYEKAGLLQPNSLDVKIGMGVAYVSGTADPMKGILLLRDVVKEDPKNVKANMSLGLFSMKTGQYEKAVKRFEVVISQTNQPEAWFYLASSYENMGMNENAIKAYIKTKELAADPGLGQFVDRKVKELKKVN